MSTSTGNQGIITTNGEPDQFNHAAITNAISIKPLPFYPSTTQLIAHMAFAFVSTILHIDLIKVIGIDKVGLQRNLLRDKNQNREWVLCIENVYWKVLYAKGKVN